MLEALPILLAATAALFALLLYLRVRHSERTCRDLFEHAPVAYHEIGRDGRLLRANQAECALLGYPQAELVGRAIWEFIVPQQREAAREAIRRKFDGAPLQPFEREYIRKDGTPLVLRVHETQVRNFAGQVVAMRSALIDVTALRRAEQAVRESEARYRDVVENAPIGLYRTTPDGQVLMVNPAMVRMLGAASAEQVTAANLEHGGWTVSYDRADFKQRLVLAGEMLGIEAEVRRSDGSEIVIREHARVVKDAAGRSLYFEGTWEDITEQKQAEERLRQSEERYRDLFQNASELIYSHDLAGNFISLNRSGELLFGYSQEEARQMNLAQVLSPDNLRRAQETVTALLGGASPHPREYEVRAKDGRLIQIESNARLLFENGRPAEVVGIARDITERKLWEEELRHKNEELEAAAIAAREATEAKSRFLANMSHEIRTPMNGVIGMTELLLGTPLGPEQQEYAEAVHYSAKALLGIINDVLDFSKLESGKLELRPEFFNPERLLEQVCALLGVEAEGKRLELRWRAEDPCAQPFVADAGRLRQVLVNLLGNALKFTESGWVEARVRMHHAGNAPMLRFEVQDTGAGISEEDAARLFERFVQVDSSITRRHGGTGLGLAISKQLIELMGGQIGLESKLGHGSTFWFTIPAVAVVQPLAPVSAEDPAPGPRREVPLNGKGRRILLAEDNEINRRIALRMLQNWGYAADAVPDGRSALDSALTGRYGLILMDVHMPEMDGFTVARRIRDQECPCRNVPIIAMTARAMPGDREECFAAGMDDYISKPVSALELRQKVESWLALECVDPPAPSR